MSVAAFMPAENTNTRLLPAPAVWVSPVVHELASCTGGRPLTTAPTMLWRLIVPSKSIDGCSEPAAVMIFEAVAKVDVAPEVSIPSVYPASGV